MQGNINAIASMVANGRKRLARQAVLTSISSIPALVYAKKILETNEGEERLPNAWGGLGVMTEEDEHAVDYEEKGYAMILLDQFTGSAINSGIMAVDSAEASFMAQIEPFLVDKSAFIQLENETGWQPESGDVLCLLIRDDYCLWVENLGQLGQSIVSDFGAKYMLAKRDDLAYLELFEKRPNTP